jgi:hypothetical protein
MDAAPLISAEVEYTFEDYREGYIAQQRSLRPPMSWKSMIAWIIFLPLFAMFLLILHLGSKSPAAPTPAPPPPPAGTLNLVLRIVLPLIPWLLILFLIWFFVMRTLGTRRPHRPVEQYIRARSLPHRGYFLWIILLLAGVYLVPTLSKPTPNSSSRSDTYLEFLPFVMVFLIIWLVLFRGLHKAQIRRAWIGQPLFHVRKRLSLDNSGLLSEDSISRNFIKWEGIGRFIETQNLFLLMSSDYSFYIFPKRVLADGGNELRALLREKILHRTLAFPVIAAPPPLPPMNQR